MAILKEFLTTESFSFLGFNVSSFILSAVIISIIYSLWLWKMKKQVTNNLIKVAFLSLAILTFLFAFLNALTGDFLFSQEENIQIYMFIAMVALFLYITDTTKELFSKGN